MILIAGALAAVQSSVCLGHYGDREQDALLNAKPVEAAWTLEADERVSMCSERRILKTSRAAGFCHGPLD